MLSLAFDEIEIGLRLDAVGILISTAAAIALARRSRILRVTCSVLLETGGEESIDMRHDFSWQVYDLPLGGLRGVAGVGSREHNFVLEIQRHLLSVICYCI